MTPDEALAQKVNEEVKRACQQAAEAALKALGPNASAHQRKTAVQRAVYEARDALIPRLMEEHNLTSVATEIKVSVEVEPRKVTEYERDPVTKEIVRSITRTIR